MLYVQKRQFNRQVTIKNNTDFNVNGDPVLNSGTVYWARFLNKIKDYQGGSIQVDASYEVIDVEASANPTLNGLMIYDSREYEIKDVCEVLNQRNELYAWRIAVL